MACAATIATWPAGDERSPEFVTLAPNRPIKPGESGLITLVVIDAPACTTMPVASGLSVRPPVVEKLWVRLVCPLKLVAALPMPVFRKKLSRCDCVMPSVPTSRSEAIRV